MKNLLNFTKKFFFLFLTILIGSVHVSHVFAQESASLLYIPLIGITSVPKPLALPKGSGTVTYRYSVKNFLPEVALTDVHVIDDTCETIKFITGDDNGDSKLDYSETWRYTCTKKLTQTTHSVATATGKAHAITATHNAYTTVVVGSNNPAPLVSIVNITKVAYPLSLPAKGGAITFTYKVNNPGVVPLTEVKVTDDQCKAMSGKLGDTNGNNLLDINEVWIYTCTMNLTKTTTNTVKVTAFANGLQAAGDATITVKVQSPVDFPDTGSSPTVKITVWKILSGILATLLVVSFLPQKRKALRK